MTALCISASLQSPVLLSTSASGTVVVGTQSFPLSVLLLIPFSLGRHTQCFFPHTFKALNSIFCPLPLSIFIFCPILFLLPSSSSALYFPLFPFLSLPLSSTIHLPTVVAPLFCFVILFSFVRPSCLASRILYIHLLLRLPCILTVSHKKLLKKSELLHLIHSIYFCSPSVLLSVTLYKYTQKCMCMEYKYTLT